MEKELKITDPIGLHARPASIMVRTASKFSSNILIKYEGKEANLKSIMSVMALGVKTNKVITLIANGSDEKEAIVEIEKSMKENNLI